jgi:NAD(P)-dependent dehydrogenase (short-subunit alcohol dehydrogenase family)
MKRLANKVVVITGGNSGIGKGIAERFINEGAKVVIFGRDAEKLVQARKAICEDILAVQGDVTNSQDLNNLYTQTQQHFGKIDCLVANAGVAERIHVDDITEEAFDYMVDVNYRGLYFSIKYALNQMAEKSSIILIGSCAAHLTMKRHSVYSSTKAAVIKLAKNLAYDLADKLIRVNSISPGYIKTPIFNSVLAKDPDFLNGKEINIPLKRVGIPADVANAALFLASDESSYVTGTDLLVDGGYAASFPGE